MFLARLLKICLVQVEEKKNRSGDEMVTRLIVLDAVQIDRAADFPVLQETRG